MRVKTWLIAPPIALILILGQSYFWIPSYESQARGNPQRLFTFIEGSSGDAKILNPILNADSASSRIVELVFDSLIDFDEDLGLRGRLAQTWVLSETAYLVAIEGAKLPDGVSATGSVLADRVRDHLAGDDRISGSVNSVDVMPGKVESRQLSVPGEGVGGNRAIVRIEWPARVRISLNRVVPDLFERLRAVLGPTYESGFDAGALVTVSPREHEPVVHERLDELLPVFEHNPEITFALRTNVRFHDGHEFDAGDVKFTYESIMEPRNLSPRTSDFEPIKRLDILDRHRIRIVYKRLFSPAINAWGIGILPQHRLDAAALEREMEERGIPPADRSRFGLRDSRFNRSPIGTGPFRFREWQSDELIHLVGNSEYWDGPPEYRSYFYRVIPDPLTQELEFRSGALDTYSPQPYQVDRYRRDESLQLVSNPGFRYTYIGYNNRRRPFDDARVRRALGMAINVDEIIEFVMYGEGETISGPFPRNTPWHDPALAPIAHDPQGARRILGELGWRENADGWLEKDGRRLEFNLITNNGNPVRKAILGIAQDSWRRIGVKCNTQVFEWAVFLQDFVNPGEFDAVVLGWSMGPDPDLFQLWHSSQTGLNQLNFVGYQSPVVDRLLEAIRMEYDRSRQREHARALHRTIAADQPYSFLYAPLVTRALDRKIVMVEPDGSLTRIRASKDGNVFYHMNRWRKLEAALEW